MDHGRPVEAPPPRPRGAASPWIEVSAWILAFAVLLAAQCAPERVGPDVGSPPAAQTRR
jgi:hypothetical protein